MTLFESFLMGGFECATHRRHDGVRLDVLAHTQHDRFAQEDYRMLRQAGIRTVRDGLRWHLIENAEGAYDWSSFLPMLQASAATGTQVIWDLCHWGIPDHIDIFSEAFPQRFAAFAEAAASLIGRHMSTVPIFCPINEISFWSWIGGDLGVFAPYERGRGPEMKRQLASASIAAMRAIREVEPRARFVQPEPLIHITPHHDHDWANAASYSAAQYEACDMLRGTLHPELGGAPELLDIIGVNYYWNNQWVHNGERVPLGDPRHRSLHSMLVEIYERYRRPIVITETGAEAGDDIGWLNYVHAEVRQAQRAGVELLGICLYPVMDYPGWDDQRHCPCGLIEIAQDWRERRLRQGLAAEVRLQQQLELGRRINRARSGDPSHDAEQAEVEQLVFT